MIVQHPSTPEHIKKPGLLAEECMAEIFPHVIATMAEFGFDVESNKFHSDMRLVVEFVKAILFEQLGLHHDLQLALGKNNVLNNRKKDDD